VDEMCWLLEGSRSMYNAPHFLVMLRLKRRFLGSSTHVAKGDGELWSALALNLFAREKAG